MKLRVGFLIIFSLCFSAIGIAQDCSIAADHQLSRVKNAISELVNTQYSDLKGFKIRVRLNHSKETFFRSGFTVESVFKKPAHRLYEVVVSDR